MSAYNGPTMAHNPQMQRPSDGRSMMAANKLKSTNAPFQNQHIIYNNMPVKGTAHNRKTDPDYFCRSHATTFAKQGVMAGGKHYVRDPLTGTWFKHVDDRRRELHDSKSDLAYRYTESSQEKGAGGKTYSIWPAPSPIGAFWKEPIVKPQKSTQFGYVDGPTQRSAPMDPKDMADPTGPLTRTASAPNFLPQSQSRKMFGLQSTMSRSGKASLGSTM